MLRFRTHKFLLGAFVSSATVASFAVRAPHIGQAAANVKRGNKTTKTPTAESVILVFDVALMRVCSRLTPQAQRPGARDATIATATLPPGSLQRMVRPRHLDARFKTLHPSAVSDTSKC